MRSNECLPGIGQHYCKVGCSINSTSAPQANKQPDSPFKGLREEITSSFITDSAHGSGLNRHSTQYERHYCHCTKLIKKSKLHFLYIDRKRHLNLISIKSRKRSNGYFLKVSCATKVDINWPQKALYIPNFKKQWAKWNVEQWNWKKCVIYTVKKELATKIENKSPTKDAQSA